MQYSHGLLQTLISSPMAVFYDTKQTNMGLLNSAIYVILVLIDIWLLGFTSKRLWYTLWHEGFTVQAREPVLSLLLMAGLHYTVSHLWRRSQEQALERESHLTIIHRIRMADKDREMSEAKQRHKHDMRELQKSYQRENDTSMSKLKSSYDQLLRKRDKWLLEHVKTVNGLRDQLAEKHAEIADTNSVLARKDLDSQQLRDEIDKTNESLRAKEHNFELYQADLCATLDCKDTKIHELESQLETKDQDLSTSQERLKVSSDFVESLRAALETEHEKRAAVETNLALAKEQLEREAHPDDSHKKEVAAVVLDFTTQHQIKLNANDEKNRQLLIDLRSTRGELEKTNGENARLTSESEALYAELCNLREAVQKHDTLLEAARQELLEQQADTALTLDTKEKANIDLQAELRAKDKDLTASQYRCTMMADDLETLRTDLRTEKQQRSVIEAELSNIKESHASDAASWDNDRQALDAALEDAAAQLSDLDAQLRSKEAEMLKISDDGKKLQLELDQVRQEDGLKQLDLEYQHGEIVSKEAKIEELTDQLVNKNRQLAELDIKLAEHQKALRTAPTRDDLAKKDAELDAKNALLDQKDADIERLRKKLNDTPKQDDQAAKEIELRRLREEIALLTSSRLHEHAQQDDRLRNLSTELDRVQRCLDAAPTNESLDAKDAEIRTLRNQFESLTKRLQNMQTKMHSVRVIMAAELKTLQTSLAAYPTKVDLQAKNDAITSLNTKLSEVLAVKQELDDACALHLHTITTQKADLEEVRSKSQDVINHKIMISAERERLRNDNKTLESQIAEMGASHDQLLSTKDGEIEKLRKLCSELGQSKEKSEKAIQDANTEIANLQNQLKILHQFTKVPAGPKSSTGRKT